ncbi:PREDICTED: thioredoxin F-type, chloroplastic-like [Ipomoea nil]|uniref:thioredoxin F-type, chloroplastic-like n=1 Tax=Ipomoea nil TaxID=35883 RepID=UPI000901E84F|nr:PREDICTED: thioredoxin F-type, chloroplastic-like [Ipomoea nil]
MALQVQVDRAALKPVMLSSSSRSTKQFVVSVAVDRRYNNPAALKAGRRLSLRVKASLDSTATATTTPALGKVTEVNKDTFWPIVEAAGEKAVVLDMYTQWCGPCKVMAPKYEELSAKYLDVVFLKLDCNQDNRPLAKELGIKVVPTFKILKSGKIVKEVTGAKLDDLIAAIECARSG